MSLSVFLLPLALSGKFSLSYLFFLVLEFCPKTLSRKSHEKKKKKIQENNRPYCEKVLFERKGEGETKLPSG